MRFLGLIIFLVIILVALLSFLKALESSRLVPIFSSFSLLRPSSATSTEATSSLAVSRERPAVLPPAPTTPPAPPVYVAPPPFVPKIEPPPGFVEKDLSPDYQKIRIGSVYSSAYFEGTQFILRADFALKEPINISGWRIKGNKKIETVIPRAVGDYSPSGLFAPQDIWLTANNYVYFYDYGQSAYNLRLNKCAGYLNDIYEFNPALPNNCPSINRRDIAVFSGECQSFLMSLWGCRAPTPNEINALSTDTACRSFLNSINYRGCYERYYRDADFFSSEWRVWLDRKAAFDSVHDRLLLFDRNGLLVDEYIY